MTGTAQTLIKTLRTHLHDNVDNYRSDIDDAEDWILIDTTRFGLEQYPKIHVQEVGGPHNRFSIGSTKRSIPNEIQISVFNNVYGEFDIDNDNEEENPEQVMSYIKDRVIQEINSNQEKWRESVECSIESFQTINNQRKNTDSEEVIGWRIDAELDLIE